MTSKNFIYGFGSALLGLTICLMSLVACGRAESRVELNGQESAEQEIRKLLREAGENEIKRDRAVAERIMADEFIRTGADGQVWDRARTLAEFPQGSSNIKSAEFQDERIRVYGDTAVVTGLGIAKGIEKSGGSFTVRNRCTFVLVRRGGRWQTVAVHQTHAE